MFIALEILHERICPHPHVEEVRLAVTDFLRMTCHRTGIVVRLHEISKVLSGLHIEDMMSRIATFELFLKEYHLRSFP